MTACDGRHQTQNRRFHRHVPEQAAAGDAAGIVAARAARLEEKIRNYG